MKKTIVVLLMNMSLITPAMAQKQRCNAHVGSGFQAYMSQSEVDTMMEKVDQKYNTETTKLIASDLVTDDQLRLEDLETFESTMVKVGRTIIAYGVGAPLSLIFGGPCGLRSDLETFHNSDFENIQLHKVTYERSTGETCQQLVTFHSIFKGLGSDDKLKVNYHEDTCENKLY